jgi:hypothetical protein
MTTSTATVTAPVYKDGKLPILFSCRVRLNEDQRQTLKQAYYKQLEAEAPAQAPRIGASQVRTSTASAPAIQRKFPSIVLSDLIGTRESIPLTTIVQLQNAFGVEVLSKQELLAAAEHYLDYVLSNAD